MLKESERHAINAQNRNYPPHLVQIPREEWPEQYQNSQIVAEVWRSRFMFVQISFPDKFGIERISVNLTRFTLGGNYQDGITWDELQDVKKRVGRGDKCAVEIYPPDDKFINEANIRHLWVLPVPPPFMWGA